MCVCGWGGGGVKSKCLSASKKIQRFLVHVVLDTVNLHQSFLICITIVYIYGISQSVNLGVVICNFGRIHPPSCLLKMYKHDSLIRTFPITLTRRAQLFSTRWSHPDFLQTVYRYRFILIKYTINIFKSYNIIFDH